MSEDTPNSHLDIPSKLQEVHGELPAETHPIESPTDERDYVEEIDSNQVVEAAEALLRQGVPHDFDLLVIGGGPGGCAAALRAAQLGANVGLIEADSLGGTFVNRGGVPASILFRAAHQAHLTKNSALYGLTSNPPPFADLTLLQDRKQATIQNLGKDLRNSLEEAGVNLIFGQARFTAPHSVEVFTGNKNLQLTAVHIIIAVGGTARHPDVAGLDAEGVIDTDQALNLVTPPKRLIILGCGVLAVEFATIFQELGSQCTIVHSEPRLLPKEDEDVSGTIEANLLRSGIDLHLDIRLKNISREASALVVHFTHKNTVRAVTGDLVLVAGGRRPNVDSLNLDQVGIHTTAGKIVVDEAFCTSASGVYAIGDSTRSRGWAHQAAAEGRTVADLIFGDDTRTNHIPELSSYRTLPEAATVGLTLARAQELGITAASSRFDLESAQSGSFEAGSTGFIKLVYDVTTERLLGCQVVCPNATDVIQVATQALLNNWSLENLGATYHASTSWGKHFAEAALKARQSYPGSW